jgi:hypothetical protein
MSLQKSKKAPARIPKKKTSGRMKTTKAGKPRQKSLQAKADKLCREYFKRTCMVCEAADSPIVDGLKVPTGGHLEWAHLKSRRHGVIRHDPLNWMALSWATHAFMTCQPDIFTKFVEQRYPGRWQRLNDLLAEGTKPDYEFWISFYERKLAELARVEQP